MGLSDKMLADENCLVVFVFAGGGDGGGALGGDLGDGAAVVSGGWRRAGSGSGGSDSTCSGGSCGSGSATRGTGAAVRNSSGVGVGQ